MKFRQYFIQSLLLVIIFISCRKEDPGPPIDNTQQEYTQYGTPFENLPAIDNIVMYEVNLRAFSQDGNLQGVVGRLDELKALGINVIWLMPIHPIGAINSVNSPYSVKDYKEVSTEYGTMEDLRNLTDEAHARGMAVLMDWVANHTAWDNPWIENEIWYTQDASGNIVHPPGTNWLDVADLNFSNTVMRTAMIDAMKFWILEANIDGYRCDYAVGVPYDFWKEAIDELKAIPDRDLILLAEGDRADHYTAGFDLTYGWSFYGALKNTFNGNPAGNLYLAHHSEYNNIPAGKHKLRFTTNHDESAWDATPVTLFGGKQGAIAASVATIFMGGVPLFYTGQEVGRIGNVPFFSNSPINWNENPDMLQTYQDILGFYNESQVVKLGTNVPYAAADVVCFKKIIGTEEVLIVINARNSPVTFALPDALQNTSWQDALTSDIVSLEAELVLQNYEFLILKNQ